MQMMGHDGPPAGIWRNNLVTKEPLARCPLRTLQLAREADPSTSAALDRSVDMLYPAYVDGHLLVAGGLSDQPMHYLEMMRTIADMNTAVDRRYREIREENGEQ